MMPLGVFNAKNTHEHTEDDGPSEEEVIWKNTLFERIETIRVPMTVELAQTDMFVTDIDRLEVGQELYLPIQPNNLKVQVEPMQTVYVKFSSPE